MRIVTVGGGPCGLYVSQLLQRQGHDVTVIEEHGEVGTPVNCAGLVGTSLIEKFGDAAVINRIDGATVHFGGRSLSLRRKGVAHVLDRRSFDMRFSDGLDISFSTRVTSVSREGTGTYSVKTPDASYAADMVIGADGPCSIVRRSLHFDASVSLYGACQQRIRTDVEDESMVTVELSRPFFSWVIPEGSGIARVGTVGNVSGLEAFKAKYGVSGEVLSSFSAPIPVGRTELVCGNAVLVGDAAAQVKPLSGGGLHYGLSASEMLASAVGGGSISAYPSAWQKEYGREISFGLSTRKVYETMSDRDLSRVFDVLCENSGRIESEGDYDNHSSLARILIGNPRLLAVLGKNLFSLLG